ncbi:hypothetical protein VTK73DRAFT_8390 [Phialemonium thermophilum]|uniref:RING-type E3 ubiquitin transferase n=1 Tax=Phialemonium thermophilum TaxID=223376 RepID=A0ABR3W8Y5_9PEZI
MVLSVPDGGLTLQGPTKSKAALPAQAFAITLSDKTLEGMIECVQNGKDIQLSLGDSPSLVFGDQEYVIPRSLENVSYDLYFSNSTSPKALDRLPNPAMSVFRQPKYLAMVQKATKGEGPKLKQKPKPQAAPAKTGTAAPLGKQGSGADADIELLQYQLAQAQSEKRENSTKIVDGPLPSKKGKLKPGKTKLLSAQSAPVPRSIPGSPALSGVASPSLGPVGAAGQQAKERAKMQRSPIVHELAVKERTFEELFSKWGGGSDKEFQTALEKVATFDTTLQKWVMNKLYWRELDVFSYPYETEEDRKKAIDNAIKQYDRMRLGVTDPLWQKLLPESERGKGICLSKIQAAIAKGPPAPAPKINVQKAEGSSSNGSGDSEKDDSGSGKRSNDGESMSRSNSQTVPAKAKKVSDGQAQARRLLSNGKKTTAARPQSRASGKPTGKSSTGKGGRVLSKEFISDSDSDSEETPLSTAAAKPKPVPKTSDDHRAETNNKPVVKPTNDDLPSKPKPVSKGAPRVKEPIKAQAVPKPPVKRSRDDDDDDSSSSGTPLSKRFRTKEQIVKVSANGVKIRVSDTSQNSRGASTGVSLAKAKNTSPTKSSPLASSPPTNASDLDSGEHGHATDVKKRRVESTSESDSYEAKPKRPKLSPEILQKAHRFKQFYASYESLHKEIVALEDPPKEKMTDLLDMRERLLELKSEIYKEVPPVD